jgi:nucleoside-diphosphate-sugar epimerase
MRSASVLVTGASGFIGYHCLDALAKEGAEVHAVARREMGFDAPNVRWHRVDLLEPGAIPRLLTASRPTHLLHFAWHVVPGLWTTAGADQNLRWVACSLELLSRFAECGGKRLVMAGSCTEYDWNAGRCSEFETATTPATFYGKCKDGLRRLLVHYSDETSLSSAWGRIFFVYGPREHPSRLVSSVARALLRDEPARCTHGSQVRDYLHVQDVADAFIALLGSEVRGPVNIGSGVPVQLKEIAFTIGDILQKRHLVQLGAVPARADEAPVVFADVTRLRDEVGWRPRHDLDSGLRQTVDWWSEFLRSEQTQPRR